ncbi:MAG TPA: trypsin-like peptidase domain-containing protein [Acidimicrobiales bacterium]|nr:trypsin-like peptidase domain-containing protein [Acidimicrobiales bacterium]
MLAASLLATTGAGVAIGHLAWGASGPATTTTSAGGALTPKVGNGNGNNCVGTNVSYFCNYFNGNGNGAGSGNSGSGGTGPANASSIASGVDPGLVDINTTISGGAAAGTGMVLTSNGEVLTNNHVIAEASKMSVYDVGNGKTYNAHVVGYDKRDDVAVIQLENASGLSTVQTADSSAVKQGDEVVAVGNAGGRGGTPSYAGGTITAKDRSITASDGTSISQSEQLTGLFATNAGIEPGDSGGPLVNSSGQVIGMDTAGSTNSNFGGFGSTMITQGFAIPINTAVALADKIVAGKRTAAIHIGKTAFLGVELGGTGTPSAGNGGGSANPFGGFGGNGSGSVCFDGNCIEVPGVGGSSIGQGTTTPSAPAVSGVQISGVVAGEPAAKAGLTAGDTITAIDGSKITSDASLSAALFPLRPGRTVQVSYVDASGTAKTAALTLAAGPPQ